MFLALYVIYKRNIYALLFSLFLYITLHYGYSAVTIFDLQKFYEVRYSTQVGAKITGIGFLFFIIAIILWRYNKLLLKQVFEVNKWLVLWCLLWFLMVIIYWIIKGMRGDFPSPLIIQDIFSACFLCILFFMFGTVLSQQPAIKLETLKTFCRIIPIIFLLIILIVVYEMVNFHALIGVFTLDSNIFVYRASFPLFNPNLLGFWCSFVAVFGGYVFHTKSLPKIYPVTILILCGFVIFLSGSRSSFIICIFTFSIIFILLVSQAKNCLKLRDIFLPFGAFILPVISGIIIVKIGNALTNCQFLLMNALTSLANRFVSIPKDITAFAISKFSTNISWLNDIGCTQNLSKTTERSIQGRLSTGIVDNGYLAMLNDTGWAGFIIWNLIWIYLIYIGIKALRISPGIRSVYSLSMLLGCAFSAMFMRSFQVFPFWVIIAMASGLSLSWSRIVLAGRNFCEHPSN